MSSLTLQPAMHGPGRFRVQVRVLWAATLLAVLLALPAAARPPELVIEAPPELAGAVRLVEAMDRAPLEEMLAIVGLDDPGPPIRVLIAAEGSTAARRAPSWSVAYALGAAGLVVLMPSRVPAYPDPTLELVLRHEIAHVLIARAARRRPVPRWFDEGLALHAAREWGLGDRRRVLFATLRRGTVSLAELDEWFHAGASTSARAYALSGAFVHHLFERYGSGVAARILAAVGDGVPFSQAFRAATGRTLGEAEDLFWRQLDWWNKWVPFITSSATLWIVITLLALLAFKRRRDRDRETLEQWEAEERRRLLEALEQETGDGLVN